MRSRYLFMLLAQKALNVGLGDFLFKSTGPNRTLLTKIDRFPQDLEVYNHNTGITEVLSLFHANYRLRSHPVC